MLVNNYNPISFQAKQIKLGGDIGEIVRKVEDKELLADDVIFSAKKELEKGVNVVREGKLESLIARVTKFISNK